MEDEDAVEAHGEEQRAVTLLSHSLSETCRSGSHGRVRWASADALLVQLQLLLPSRMAPFKQKCCYFPTLQETFLRASSGLRLYHGPKGNSATSKNKGVKMKE